MPRTTDTDIAEVLAELAAEIEGEVSGDLLSRMLYATDASPYQRLPLAIARPRHREDCIAIMNFAARRRLPLIPRGAGTSLAGQCVGDGLVIDFTRHLNRIGAIDAGLRRVRVQPGVIRDDLNDALHPSGWMFAPDPSTSRSCTIGGMMGNNAWGSHVLRYGTTRDHVVSVEAVLSDGSPAHFGALTAAELGEKLGRNDLEGRIYRGVFEAVDSHRELILDHYPCPDGISRNAGYPLDVLAKGQPWNKDGAPFNLARFLCGCEGTLALITEIELNLVPLPSRRRLLCVHFESLEDALTAVSPAMRHRPAALELLDRPILALTRDNLEQQRNRFWIEGDPSAILLIEFNDDLTETAEPLAAELRRAGLGYSYVVLDPPRSEQAWALRAAGLGLLMGSPSRAKAVTGIEDTAVAVADLPAYVRAVEAVMARHQTNCVMYGPAARGVLHLRPELDLSDETGREKFVGILNEVTDLAIRFGGTTTAKHGDGRLRAPFLERLLGSEVISLMRRIKTAFDPEGLLNPGKTFDSLPLTEDLRIRSYRPDLPTHFDWGPGFKAATYQCNGAGVCLKSAGRGTMCPSYMATREEKHGTRGRANLFRQVMERPGSWSGEGGELLREVLDLCLSCKGCKSECPANVDMARMKAEFLQHFHDESGLPWRARLVGNFDRLSRIASHFPGLTNRLLDVRWIKSLLGFHPDRRLPKLAPQRFSRWLKGREPAGQGEEVVLVNDPFSEYYEPQVAIAAYEALTRLGYRILVPPCLESGRIQISQGLLRRARERLNRAIELLFPHAAAGRWIVGLEPSEILTFHDEGPDLVKGETLREKATLVANRTLTFEEFIDRELRPKGKNPFGGLGAAKKLLVHGHCHQKSLVGMQPLLNTLSLIPDVRVESIPSGCCGMAGVFGYEHEHYEISLKIAELVLFPAIRQAESDTLIVAPGVSCRAQISDGLGVRAFHPAEVLRMALSD